MKRRVFVVCSLLSLGGCSMMTPHEPAPVEEASVGAPPSTVTAPPAEESGVEIYAYGAPPPTAIPEQPPVEQATAPRRTVPATSAVSALLEEAERQRQVADYAAAVATLERALRIEPRNPLLWNRLAWIRLEQGQYPLAGSLAAKSNALAGNDLGLKRENAEIIARARGARAGSGGLQ